MARIKKFAPEQKLTSFQTFVVDENPNSDYFRITEFKDTFTGGKNGFLIEGSEYLKESTEIKIEILDVEGNPVYYEPGNGIPEYYEGISKLVAVYVYNDTPIGLGKITILGELKEYDDNGVKRTIPAEWQGAYNVKWERTFQINKNLANEDKVRFYRRPQITIDEIVKPIFSGNPPLLTQTGSVSGIPLVPTENSDLSNFRLPTSYRLLIDSGSGWTGSMENQTITFDNISYSPTIDDVVSDTEIIVSPPYTENNIVKSFTDENYSVSFTHIDGISDLATALTGSFAKINISDMNTFVGDAARVKVFRRSQSNLTDFEFVQEIQLESNELLRDITTFAKKEENYGIFTEDVLQTYWVTSSNDLTAELNQNFLYNSVKLDSSASINSFFTSESFDVRSGVEYTLTFNVRKEDNSNPDDYIEVFLGSTPGPIVEDTSNSIPCSQQSSYSGGESYPTEESVNLGENTGNTNLQFTAQTVPDRFIVEWDGNVVIDSGYRGGTQYDFGGASRSAFTSELTGELDPITGNTYPDFTTYPDDGYPRVITNPNPLLQPGSGSADFNKTSSSPQLATVKVYAPMAGTAWDFTLNCPEVEPLSGIARISNPTTTQTITTVESTNTVLQKTPIEVNFLADDINDVRLYFEVSGSGWYMNNVSLKASQETSFSPDVITFIQQVPKTLVTETFDYRFEFYDINNNYIPVRVEETKTFTGGNTNLFNKSIEITPDNLYFSFDSASNPANAVPPLVINFDVETNLVTGSITYTSGAYDFFGNEISASEYIGGQYPGYLTDWDVDGGRQPFLRVQDFTGSREDITVQFIRYTAAVEDVSDTFIITRVEDGKGGVSFEIVPFRGTQIKNKESKTLEVQAVRVDGINRIDLQSGLTRDFSEAKLHLLSSSFNGVNEVTTYVSLSQAITDTNFVEGISAGLTGSGEIDYNAIFTRDAIDNELTLYLMDGPTSESILTSLILTDLKDGLNPGLVQSTTEQFNIKYKPRELSPFNPQQSIVTASFQRRGTTLNPLSASLVIYPSSSIEPKTELPHFYMFYETGAFDDTITLNVTDGLGNSINSGIPGDSVTYYVADETKQLNLEFTYTEPITSASVTANKSFFITPDGLPGQNAIVIDIDPQPVALGSNHKGEVYNYDLANTDIQITQGDLFLINNNSGDPGTFTTRSVIPTNIQFTTLDGESTTTMSLAGFESMSALSASIRYDFDIYPYFTSSLVTASRTQKFTKVVEGAGAIDVSLDPIAVSFNADESGFIFNYSAAETEIIVKQNDEYLVYDSTNSGNPGTFITSSIVASNITFTEISSSNLDSNVNGDEILHIKGFGEMSRTDVSASVIYNLIAYPYGLKAGVAGVPVNVSKKQTFSKVNDGSAARKVSLKASSDTVVYDGDGTKIAPSGDIQLTATAFNNSGSAYFKFLNEEGGTIGASSTNNTLILGDLPPTGSTATFTVELRDGTSDGLVLDTDSVTITGIQEGSTAYSVVLSNPASSVTVEVDGTKYFDNTGTLIRAYKGGTELQFVEEYDESALDPITFLPIGTFGQFSASIHEVSTFLTHSDGRVVETTGELFASSSGVSNWDNPQDNTQGFITYKIDFENGRGTQFVQQSFSTVFEGATGPGVVFRGPWTGSIEYIYNLQSKRRDAVLWSENGLEPYDTYYATKESGSSYLVPSGSGNEPTIGGALNELYWESLGQEEFFVAAKIAIFEESFVKNTINVGQPATSYDVNPQITIYGGDSEPYISIGQSIQGYGQEGVFIGVTEDGGPNGTAGTTGLLSIEDSTGESYFRWDGYGLEVKSDDVIIETDNLTIDSQNEKISIGQGTQGFQQEGVYIGKDGTDYTLSLRGAPVGGEYNSLEWDGSVLTLRGAIRQTAAGVIEPSLRGTWTAGETYYPQDLVQYLGETWSSNTQHTATDNTNATTGRPGSGPWTIAAGGGKVVNLVADSYVITYDEYGANPSPSGTMTLTANTSNFVDGYFKFTGGGAVFTDETTFTDGDTANSDTASFTIPTSYFSTPLQFRVGVAEGDQDEKVSDTITITAVQPGADSTPMYFITPIAGGTQIKNSSGTIELQVQKSDSTGLSNISSGDIKIYSGANLVTTLSGVTGTDYNPTLNAASISGTLTLTLKDGSSTYDTITLVDVSDGLGGGSFISPNLKSTRNPADNSFLPTTLQATASFFDTSGTEYQAEVLITPSFSGGVDRMAVSAASGDTTEITITASDGDGGAITLGGASVPTKDVVLTAVFTDPATGQTTTINETFYIISDGLDGLDAITVINTNQAHTLPASDAGVVSSFAGSGTRIEVYEGTTKLAYDATPDGGDWYISGETITPTGDFTIDSSPTIGADYIEYGNGTAMDNSTDSVTITYTITGKRINGEAFTAQTIQTITKSKAGENGTSGVNAKTIRLSTTHQAFVVANDGSVSPDYITLSVNKQNTTATTSWSTSPTVTLHDAPTGGNTTTTGDTVYLRKASFGANTASTITATADGLSDEITIVKVAEGTDAITIVLSNESHTFQADSGGTISDYGGSGTTITLYEGATQLDYDGSGATAGHWNVAASLSNINTSSISDGGNYAVVGDFEDMTANQASATYTITGKKLNGDSFSFTKIQSFTKSIAGENGTSGTDGAKGDPGDGAGIVFRGEYDANNIYYYTANRRDVVKGSDGNYYLADNQADSGTSNWDNPVGGSDWTSFGTQFTSVATDILFAQDVFAEYTLNVGASGSSAVIALNADAPNANANPYISIGQGVSQGYGNTGIFMGFDSTTPKLSLYGNDGFIDFDGTDFTYSGLVTGSVVQGGELLIGFDTESNQWNFVVDSSGNVTARGATNNFTGTVNANDGNIGAWTVDDNAITSTDGQVELNATEEFIEIRNSSLVPKVMLNTDSTLFSPGTATSVTFNSPVGGYYNANSSDNDSFLGTSNHGTIDSTAITTRSSTFTVSTSGVYSIVFEPSSNRSYVEATGELCYINATTVINVRAGSDTGTIVGTIGQYSATATGFDQAGGGLSVVGNTELTLSDGTTILAKDITKEHTILAWDELNSKYSEADISKVHSRSVDSVFRVTAGNNSIEVSDSHGFWLDEGRQIKVNDIVVGETKIYVRNGDTIELTTVDSVEEIFGEEEVYTLTIPQFANYISNDIISHNIGDSYPETDRVYYPATTKSKTLSLSSGTTYYLTFESSYEGRVVSTTSMDFYTLRGVSYVIDVETDTLSGQSTNAGTEINDSGLQVASGDTRVFRADTSTTAGNPWITQLGGTRVDYFVPRYSIAPDASGYPKGYGSSNTSINYQDPAYPLTRAMCRVTLSGSGPTVTAVGPKINVASVTRTGLGIFRVNLQSELTNWDGVAMASSHGRHQNGSANSTTAGNGEYVQSVGIDTANADYSVSPSVTLNFKQNSNNANIDPHEFYFVMFG